MNHLDGCPAELKHVSVYLCVCVCVCVKKEGGVIQAGRWMTNTDTSFLNLRAINFPSSPWTFTLFSIVTNRILLAASTHGTQ